MAKKRRRTNAEWSAETRAKLLTAARRAFQMEGYDAASVAEIARAAKLTKGAVYHHYEDKRSLFRAVLEQEQRELVSVIERVAIPRPSPFEGVVKGCEAFLETVLDEKMARIILIDGPRVLGWLEWRRIDAETGGRSLREGLDAAIEAGQLKKLDPEILTTIISGALNEAALSCLEATAPDQRKRAVILVLRQLLDGLRR